MSDTIDISILEKLNDVKIEFSTDDDPFGFTYREYATVIWKFPMNKQLSVTVEIVNSDKLVLSHIDITTKWFYNMFSKTERLILSIFTDKQLDTIVKYCKYQIDTYSAKQNENKWRRLLNE